jgi:hypothetical protein
MSAIDEQLQWLRARPTTPPPEYRLCFGTWYGGYNHTGLRVLAEPTSEIALQRHHERALDAMREIATPVAMRQRHSLSPRIYGALDKILEYVGNIDVR